MLIRINVLQKECQRTILYKTVRLICYKMKNEKKKNSNPHTHWSEPLILVCNTKFNLTKKRPKTINLKLRLPSSLISSWLFFIIFYQILEHSQLFHKAKYMRLSLPNVRQNFGKRTFLFTGAKNKLPLNKLPLNIVKSEDIQTFCRRARHFFL